MKRTLIVLLSILFACNTTEPPPPYVRTVELTAEDASCTEAWIRVRVTNGIQPPVDLRLTRGGHVLQTLRLTTADSLLIDEGLLPNHPYIYKAYRLTDSQPVDSSDVASISTMDTTSHNFTWQVDTLGVTASTLYDVGIINDTLAYAVGEMYLRDSTGQVDPILYNLAQWNGQTWTCQRILYNGSPFTTRWILAFGWNDIWINEHTHWDGNTWSFSSIGNPLFDGVRTSKAWGVSSRDFYVVGDGGFIAHYNGSTWQRLESGTGLRVQDINGPTGNSTVQNIILSVASDKFTDHGVAVLQIMGTQAIPVQVAGLPLTSVVSIWNANGRKWYVCGDGIYTTNNTNAPWQTISGVPPIYTEAVRGNASNDFFVVGDFGLVLHCNGITWRDYSGNVPAFPGQYQAVAVKGEIVIAVGFLNNGRAIALRGRR